MKKDNILENGITLIALVTTIIILLILAGITINGLIGKNGIIRSALRAKEEYQNATNNEKEELNSLFRDNYAEYNGKLSIKNGKLVNQHGEIMVLRGMSAGNGNGIKSLTEKYYNKEALTNIKSWGANVFRIPVDTHSSYKGYVGLNEDERKEMIERVCDIADICIELDMYVIIDWHTLKEANPNDYIQEAKEFFSTISERYKEKPNVLYEICNEPYTTWENLKNYANEIVPVIEKNTKDAIIILGTPDRSHNLNEVINDNNKLEYNNIMYTFHAYPNYLNSNHMKMLENAMKEKIPVFVTEWGAAQDFSLGGLFLETSNMLTNYMKKNDISWCNWNMTDMNEALALVQPGKWDNSLTDSILSDSGKYVKKLFQNISMEDYPIMMDRVDGYAFWSDEYRENITEIIFDNTIDQNKIDEAVKSWDISYPTSAKKVIAYIEDDPKNIGKYILNIVSDGKVCSAPDSNNLFSYFINVEKIDVSELNTSSTYHMGAMFAGLYKLKEINLENFNTINVKQLDYMFDNCRSLENIDLTSFNTSNVRQMEYMFRNCSNLKNINLSSFNTTKVTNMTLMFNNASSIERIDFRNATFTTVKNYTDMFTNIKDNPIIIVKDKDSKTFIEDRFEEANKTANISV